MHKERPTLLNTSTYKVSMVVPVSNLNSCLSVKDVLFVSVASGISFDISSGLT